MKKVTITSENITQKQWSNLILELNLIRKEWKPYATLDLEGSGVKKIINCGTNGSTVTFLTKMGMKNR